MATVYEFEGNLVRKVERTVQEVGRVSDLLPTLFTYHPIALGRLPKDTVFLSAKPTASAENRVDARVIVQQPPQVRELLFNESGEHEDSQAAFRLQMPYFCFWFNMRGSPVNRAGEPESMVWAPQSWGIFWMRRQFDTIDTPDTARAAKMPNSWGDTRVCFGSNAISGALTLGAHIDTLINIYWTSVFNTDLDVHTPYAGRARTQLNRWAAATARNSDAWINWDIWQNQEQSISTLIEPVAGHQTFMQPAPDSTEPVVPRPPVERTWYAIQEWVNEQLTDDQRNRLTAVLTSE